MDRLVAKMTARHHSTVIAIIGLTLVACSGAAIPGTGRVTPQMRVVGGDLLLQMIPGGGENELARGVAMSLTRVMEGDASTARHLASVAWEGGRADLVIFRSADRICLSVLGGSTCGPDLMQAVGVIMVGSGEAHNVLVGVPDGGTEVVFTTSEGHTISVLPLDGFALAVWPTRLGPPAEVKVFDANGEEVWHEEIDLG
jgi:hypothetical protein